MQEEIFGPVVCVVPFETEEDVIERANNVNIIQTPSNRSKINLNFILVKWGPRFARRMSQLLGVRVVKCGLCAAVWVPRWWQESAHSSPTSSRNCLDQLLAGALFRYALWRRERE